MAAGAPYVGGEEGEKRLSASARHRLHAPPEAVAIRSTECIACPTLEVPRGRVRGVGIGARVVKSNAEGFRDVHCEPPSPFRVMSPSSETGLQPHPCPSGPYGLPSL